MANNQPVLRDTAAPLGDFKQLNGEKIFWLKPICISVTEFTTTETTLTFGQYTQPCNIKSGEARSLEISQKFSKKSKFSLLYFTFYNMKSTVVI